MDLDFIKEDTPKVVRIGGKGREPERWEQHLAPMKEHEGTSYRVWTYDKRPAASARAQTVNSRLRKAAPNEDWQIAVRPVPGTENQFGVYVVFAGVITDEEVATRTAKREARTAKVRAARQTVADAAPAATNGDAAKRVAAVKARR